MVPSLSAPVRIVTLVVLLDVIILRTPFVNVCISFANPRADGSTVRVLHIINQPMFSMCRPTRVFSSCMAWSPIIAHASAVNSRRSLCRYSRAPNVM